MQAGSTRSQETLLEGLDEVLDAGVDAATLGSDLFGVVAMLDREPTLRRVLTEPSVAAEARAGMARSLLDGKVSDEAVRVVESAVSQRWSRSRDLVDALERCAVIAETTRADQAGELDALEDDLFRFGRILAANTDLRDALSDRAAPMEVKRTLLDSLVTGKVGEVTKHLLDQLLVGRQRSLAAGLAHYQEVTAARQQRLVATVWVAAPLGDDQKSRLAESLATQYSHEVHLNVIVDTSVLGGVRVSIGDDVIDSTVETRLAQAQRRLVR
ncbi:MAG: F0F1 ATP synthase subunit delta [Nocardioidaceae bacterium]